MIRGAGTKSAPLSRPCTHTSPGRAAGQGRFLHANLPGGFCRGGGAHDHPLMTWAQEGFGQPPSHAPVLCVFFWPACMHVPARLAFFGADGTRRGQAGRGNSGVPRSRRHAPARGPPVHPSTGAGPEKPIWHAEQGQHFLVGVGGCPCRAAGGAVRTAGAAASCSPQTCRGRRRWYGPPRPTARPRCSR